MAKQDNSYRKYKPEVMAEAITKARGIKAAAARKLGCDRGTVSAYIKHFDLCKEAYEQANQTALDYSESRLMRLCRDKNHKDHFSAIRFHLRTKGRGRGYGDSMDVTSGNEPISHITIVAPPDVGADD